MVEVRRRIVSRHWTREAARRSERRLQRWLDVVDAYSYPTPAGVDTVVFEDYRHAQLELDDVGMPLWASSVRVERAGRVRARWVVVAVG